MLDLNLSRASLSMISSSVMDNMDRTGHDIARNSKNRGEVGVPGTTELAMLCLLIITITITITTIMRRMYTCSVKMGTLMRPWKLFTMMYTGPFQLGFTSPSSRHVARPRLFITRSTFTPTLTTTMYSSRVSSETSW